MPYKAENWHASSHGKYFSQYRFLDICQRAFNDNYVQQCSLQKHLGAFLHNKLWF